VRELAAPPSSWQYDDFFVSVLPPRIRALKPPAKARLPVAVQVRDNVLQITWYGLAVADHMRCHL
jgi:hypothetical protein